MPGKPQDERNKLAKDLKQALLDDGEHKDPFVRDLLSDLRVGYAQETTLGNVNFIVHVTTKQMGNERAYDVLVGIDAEEGEVQVFPHFGESPRCDSLDSMKDVVGEEIATAVMHWNGGE